MKNSGILIAVGGLSGTGKSTLGRGLAELFDVVSVETDAVRKELWGIDPREKLPPEAYTDSFSKQTYQRFNRLCMEAVLNGRVVLAQAVFKKPAEREEIEQIARECQAEFQGIWLEAPKAILKDRVGRRVNDISDATPGIVDLQSAFNLGEIGWEKIDTAKGVDAVREDVAAFLLLHFDFLTKPDHRPCNLMPF